MRISTLIAVLVLSIPMLANAGEPVATLELSTTRLRVRDPVVARVRLANTGKNVLALDKPVSNGAGTVHFEFRRANDIWQQAPLENEGVLLGERMRPISIATGASCACLEFIYLSRHRGFVLATEGEWEVRACIWANDRFINSAAVKITVKPIPENERLFLDKHVDKCRRLAQFIGHPKPGDADELLLREGEKLLTDSELKSQVAWQLLLLTLLNREGDELSAAMREAKADADKLTELKKLPRCVALASVAVAKHREDLIELLLKDCDPTWDEVQALHHRATIWKKQQEKRRQDVKEQM